MDFEFATATRIIFGAGKLALAAQAAAEMGNRVFLVTGRSSLERHERVLDLLAAQGVDAVHFPVCGEPTVSMVREGVELARDSACDIIVALGGGSAIDAGKAVSALLANEGDLLDYLEVIGKGNPITQPAAPCIAVPTTAGTGAEVTRNSVLSSPEHGVKVSLRSPRMLPRLAVVDPELTLDLPPSATAATGMDALTQLIEPYVSMRANPMTDALCLEGIKRSAGALRRACAAAQDLSARCDMAFASLMGGLALANAGLGVVHGFAAPVGGMFPAPHGAVCAALLAPGMEANIRALREREPGGPFLDRYRTLAVMLTGNPGANPEAGADHVRKLCSDLGIPRLRAYGITEGDFPALVEKAARASSMKGNPIALTPEELTAILRKAR
jgi:alcohol dehydrogenase class IV